MMSRKLTGALFALALGALTTSASAAALGVTQNANIAGGMAGFGPSTTVLDWDLGGAPGSASGATNIQNWLNGVGFAGFDLAINGTENVTWTFAGPVRKVGFAISTGLENVFANQINHAGAVFQLSTNSGDTGSLTLLDRGQGYAAWVEVSSATAFTSLTFFEPSGDIYDQYWGDVVATTRGVPEPATWALMITGFGLAGASLRRRRVAAIAS